MPVLSSTRRSAVFESIVETLLSSAGQILALFDSFLDCILGAFPFPLRIIDCFVGLASGVQGILLAFPFDIISTSLIQASREAGYQHKLMTTTNAIKLPFEAIKEMMFTVSGLGPSSLREALARALARSLWRYWKDLKLLRKVLRVKDELDFYNLLESVFKSRVAKVGRLAVVYAAVGFMIIFTTGTVALGLGLMILFGSFEKMLLFQDSKLVRVKVRRNYRRRDNLRTGPDS